MATQIKNISDIKTGTTLVNIETGEEYQILGIINNEAAVITKANPEQYHIDDLKKRFIIVKED